MTGPEPKKSPTCTSQVLYNHRLLISPWLGVIIVLVKLAYKGHLHTSLLAFLSNLPFCIYTTDIWIQTLLEYAIRAGGTLGDRSRSLGLCAFGGCILSLGSSCLLPSLLPFLLATTECELYSRVCLHCGALPSLPQALKWVSDQH